MEEGPVGTVDCPSLRGIPALGLGTFEMRDEDQCFDAIQTALDIGYRHIDTAQLYGNEGIVGQAIEESPVRRNDVYLATKVKPENLSYESVINSTYRSLDRLDVEYVDILYVHWPFKDYDEFRTLDAFEELHSQGVIDSIGLSNFTPDLVKAAEAICNAPIAALQVECHPFLPQYRLHELCKLYGIQLVGYAPLAHGEITAHPRLTEISQALGMTPAQLSLAWLRNRGIVAIPKSTDSDHLRENWASLEYSLDRVDARPVNALKEMKRVIDPPAAPWNSQ